MRSSAIARILTAVVLLAISASAQRRTKPSHANVAYGPHARHVLDFWQAESETPTPLVVWIHGGGFRGGDKRSVRPELLDGCLRAGISVASINYRLSQHAPFPAPMHDGGRAIQFLRSRAEEWNFDPARVAASGSSAGAGISLWLGYHDDLAQPDSDDPVARESTRLTCMVVFGAQSSYDPRFIREVIGGRAWEHSALRPFYGLERGQENTPAAHALYERASPINFVSAGDPPAFLYYTEAKAPLPDNARPGRGIHHPRFGVALKEKLDPLGIECVLRHRDDYREAGRPADPFPEILAFLREHLAPDVRSHIYKKTEQGALSMHVHLPPGWKPADRRPAIVFFFGGGWTGGNVKQFEPQARRLASLGMVAARADYRVKRRHGVSPVECVEDAASAIRWVRTHCRELGVDPRRIVAAGGSAGGHIAACTALSPGFATESSRPNAMILFNPVLRFTDSRLAARVGGDKEVAARISPVLHVTKDTPPALLLYGTRDRLIEHGEEYVEASALIGNRADWYTAEGVGHGFFNRSPWRERTLERVEQFLLSLNYVTGEPGTGK